MEKVREVCREKIHFEAICAVSAICKEAEVSKQFAEMREMMENVLEDDGEIRHLEEYVSPDYLSRTFKKETGRSQVQYMLEKRVEKVKRLLQSDMSVKNVALQTG